MKKTAAVLLAVILVLSLCACGGGGNENTSVSNKRTAITTNDFVAKAKELGYEVTVDSGFAGERQKEAAQFRLGKSDIAFVLFETPEAAKRWYTNWYNESADAKKGAKNIEKGSGENWMYFYSEIAGGFRYYCLIDDTVVTVTGRNMEDKDKTLDFLKGLGY